MTTSLDDQQTNHLMDSNATVTEEEPITNRTISVMTTDEERNMHEENKSSDLLPNGNEGMNHDDALMHSSPSIVTDGDGENEQQETATPTTSASALVNLDDDEHRSKKSFDSKMKSYSQPSYRPNYYPNGHPYAASMPYYYYSSSSSLDKPAPLMFIPTQAPLATNAQTSSQASSSASSSSSSSSSRENPTGNSTNASSANLPPRLRQTSTTENDSHSTGTSTGTTAASATTTTPSAAASNPSASGAHSTTNGRRHRSIFPRGYPSFYAQHPPPPLMATPPGVLYPYPPIVHPAAPMTYNIRSTEELEYFAYTQGFVPVSPAPLLWTSPSQTPLPSAAAPTGYPGYPMADLPAGYIYSSPAMIPTNATPLNPEAAEWVPPSYENSSESNEAPIQLDDETSFPPLNGSAAAHMAPTVINHAKDHRTEEIVPSSETPVETQVTKDDQEETNTIHETSTASVPSETKVETTPISTSSQELTTNSSALPPASSSSASAPPTKPTVLTSSSKVTPVTYSTVILQTSDNQKSTKANSQPQPRRAPTTKERPSKPAAAAAAAATVGAQTRANGPPSNAAQNNNNHNTHRRQPMKNNSNGSRNIPLKQQQVQAQVQIPSPVTDEWIEVKSKKTKKFDRFSADSPSEKIPSEEQVQQTISPPSSLPSTGENTTTPFSSEDDFDEKDQTDVVVLMNNTATNDYNQTTIDDIHRRLDRHDRLLILMRGCPGSGKSTLAASLNAGYNGIILSTDDFFTDKQTNDYRFDYSQLDEAHLNNRRRVADALKRNISPIIVDNTNTQIWEMKPYVAMAKEAGYDILLVEPQTPWRYKARELTKRNRHDLPLKRIKEMLNRFEHNITVQNILDQLPFANKTNRVASISEQTSLPVEKDVADPILQSKKVYDFIDDSLILEDVRLCINDMILLLTSQIYQTALSSYTSILTNTTTTTTTSQSSTPLSVSFHDLSLISSSSTSLPSTPSTPHGRLPRSLARFPSSTGQEHPFNSEHFLRLPNSLARCMDSISANQFSPVLSSQTSLLAKKRRKQKSQTPTNNEPIYNTNNNNNNQGIDGSFEVVPSTPSVMFNVFLAEDCPDVVVIDEVDGPNDGIVTVKEKCDFYSHPAQNPPPPPSVIPPKSKDENVLHEFNQSSDLIETNGSSLNIDAAIQCSPNDLTDLSSNHSDRILTGHSTPSSSMNGSIILPPRPGYQDCGIQVEVKDSPAAELNQLIELYSTRASVETIRQFYEASQSNFEWTKECLDEYLEQRRQVNRIPSLQHLALVALDKWDEQIKAENPAFDATCLTDLLQDLNEETTEENNFDPKMSSSNAIEWTDANQIHIPWSMLSHLQGLYGELPDKSFFFSNADGIVLPIDDDLSISIYQALQRCLIKSQPAEQSTKPVTKTPVKNENKRKASTPTTPPTPPTINVNQRWLVPGKDQATKMIPSLKQIMREEERQATACEKSKQKRPMDYATEHKFKELQRQFPQMESDLLFDVFRSNDYDYEMALVCVATLLDEDPTMKKTPVVPTLPSSSVRNSVNTNKGPVEPVVESYESLRGDALQHAQRRREFYAKADQANRHGMTGVASFYMHRASEETRLMKDANRAACERLCRWRLEEFSQTQKLDLHGLHVDEALQLFKQVEQQFVEGNRRTTPKTIEIITGYGKSSVYGGGQGKIRPAILTYIQQRNYKYSEPNKGVILLHLMNTRN